MALGERHGVSMEVRTSSTHLLVFINMGAEGGHDSRRIVRATMSQSGDFSRLSRIT